ncbi:MULTISPECIES: ArgE/DapE family deacylase [Natrialbaceae]|uniref:ArgE/DapE family deacylase n=1 Tax=Natrialbaceae TaxID=1644061 RepID=UPI00207D6502|nr:ArgE/DapE family deacylase [Natronococcus sp. CG52]
MDADRSRRAVVDHIANSRDELVDLLCELVAQPSVAGDERAVQETIAAKLDALGLEPDVWEPDDEALRDHPGFFETTSYQRQGYEGRPNVAARIDGGDGRSLGLSGHVDVVPVEAESWTTDPWEPTVIDGRVYGRGTMDMKGGIAAALTAVRALVERDVSLGGDLLLQTTIEEEEGGCGGVLSALERGYRPDAAIIPEPYGVPNVGIASAGVLYFRLTVHGKASHAARGYEGVNAFEKATKLSGALAELDRERKARISYPPAARSDPAAEGSVTNLNVGIVRSGDWVSTVPSRAVLECRIGWPPGESRDDVRRQVREAVDGVVENDEWLAEHPPGLEWFGWSAEPHEVPRDAEILSIAKRRAEEVTGDTTEYVGGLAGMDERFYNNYYDIPCVTVGPSGENGHGADESVEIESLVETAQTIALSAMDWCGIDE